MVLNRSEIEMYPLKITFIFSKINYFGKLWYIQNNSGISYTKVCGLFANVFENFLFRK